MNDLSLLSTITSDVTDAPPRLVVYGTEGVGKSTFAAGSPSPIFIQTEEGLRRIKTKKFPLCKTFGQFQEQLTALCTEQHEFQTVVIDTIDWLEKLIWANVAEKAQKASITDIGYGKGYEKALDIWREVLAMLDYLNDKGMAILLLAHAKVERFEDPENAAYDRYTLRLHKSADATIREWSDAVLFATKRIRIEKEDNGFKERKLAKAIGADGGERILRTSPGPACVAKNRYGITGDIPLSWDALAQHL